MVKFRTLFGEASRHKKGQTADLFAVHVLSISESAITHQVTPENVCSQEINSQKIF
jgi:hypothetical protein